MNTNPLTPIGCGWSRNSYRKMFWKLFRITQSGTPSIICGFEAKRLFGNLWWVNLKSFRAYCNRYHGGTFNRGKVTKRKKWTCRITALQNLYQERKSDMSYTDYYSPRFRTREDALKYADCIRLKKTVPPGLRIFPFIIRNNLGHEETVENPEYRNASYEQRLVMLV